MGGVRATLRPLVPPKMKIFQGYILCISIIPPPLQEIIFFPNTKERAGRAGCGGGGRGGRGPPAKIFKFSTFTVGGKNEGVWKLNKGENGFPPYYFFPKPYVKKKIILPLFSFSSFSFPLSLLFHFISHCLSFSFFSPAPFPPPLAIVFCTIYTPAYLLYETKILLDMVFGFLFFRGKGCALPMCKKFKYKIVLGARTRELELES